MHFRDIGAQAGLTIAPHSSSIRRYLVGTIGGALLDCDNNGWPDLFVTNEAGQNYLYHNKRDSTFEETGIASGTGLGPDGDRNLDLIVTRYGKQPASIDWNNGRDFTGIATEARMTRPTCAPVKWGTGFGDFGNDGWIFSLPMATFHLGWTHWRTKSNIANRFRCFATWVTEPSRKLRIVAGSTMAFSSHVGAQHSGTSAMMATWRLSCSVLLIDLLCLSMGRTMPAIPSCSV
jgi:hypothetical protein